MVCVEDAGLGIADRVDHQLNIFRVGIRRDAMAEVEDMRPLGKCVDEAAGFADEIIAACHHVAALEVALNATAGLHVLGGPFGADAIVKGDAIRAGGGMCANVAGACAAREGDDWNAGMAKL